jgi:hypothetical protein
MLENTEGVIKNERSRETDNINQNKNTTQYALDTIIRKQTQLTSFSILQHLFNLIQITSNHKPKPVVNLKEMTFFNEIKFRK